MTTPSRVRKLSETITSTAYDKRVQLLASSVDPIRRYRAQVDAVIAYNPDPDRDHCRGRWVEGRFVPDPLPDGRVFYYERSGCWADETWEDWYPPAPVSPAKPFNQWVSDTAALLEECAERGQ